MFLFRKADKTTEMNKLYVRRCFFVFLSPFDRNDLVSRRTKQLAELEKAIPSACPDGQSKLHYDVPLKTLYGTLIIRV
jgi:hypothetical protein